MKLLFLGTSHGHSEVGRHCTSVYFEHNGHGFLLDAGAPVQYLLTQRGIPLDGIKAIFVTHMHADHTPELPTLVNTLNYHKQAAWDVYLPEERAMTALNEWMNANHWSLSSVADRFRMHTVKAGVIYEQYGIRVTAILTEHCGGGYPSYAYMIESDDGKRILFTGDLAYDFHDFPAVTREKHFDLIVSELVHLSALKACEILKDVDTKILIFYHLGLHNIRSLEKHQISFDFPYVIATDGFEYYVN